MEQPPEGRRETDADRMEAWGRGKRNADVAYGPCRRAFARIRDLFRSLCYLLGATKP